MFNGDASPHLGLPSASRSAAPTYATQLSRTDAMPLARHSTGDVRCDVDLPPVILLLLAREKSTMTREASAAVDFPCKPPHDVPRCNWASDRRAG